MESAKRTKTAGTGAVPQGEVGAGPAPEQQNTMQKFLASLLSSVKEESKEPDAAPEEEAGDAKIYTEEEFKSKLEAEKRKWKQQSKEQEREQSESETKDEELSKLRAELLQRDLKDAAQSKLGKEGYPVGLAELLNYTDQASMEQSLAHTQEIFKAALQTAIKEKLRGRTPQGLAGASNTGNAIRDEISRNIKGGFN